MPMMPVITFLGMMIAEILAGSIVVEQVFALPGIGRLLISSVGTRDLPVVEILILYITFVVIFVYFIVVYSLPGDRSENPQESIE